MTIRKRLWLSVTALLGLILLGNGLVVMGVETRELHRSLIREARTFSLLAGPQSLRVYGESGMREDSPRVRERLEAIALGLPSLHGFAVVSDRGKVLLRHPAGAVLPPLEDRKYGDEGEERLVTEGGEKYIELVTPIRVREGGPEVLFQILVSEDTIKERLTGLVSVYAGSFLLLLATGALVAAWVAGAILRPVFELTGAAIKIRDGDLSARAEAKGSGEIGDLSRAFNDMAQRVQAHRDELEEKNSALQKAYGELQAMQDELVALERMAAVGRTASAVSHEIDNPVGVILGTVQMLKDELREEKELYADAELIEEECKRVRRIVRDLLDFARPGAGTRAPVDLPALAGHVLRGLGHHPQFRRITFKASWPEDFSQVIADADGLKQVFLNLLINSAKAMDFCGEIELCGEEAEGSVRVSILDRGCGIPPENLEKIFEPFFTTGEGGTGSGLGLSVSKRIIGEHGGKLWAENRPGGGGALRFELPAEG